MEMNVAHTPSNPLKRVIRRLLMGALASMAVHVSSPAENRLRPEPTGNSRVSVVLEADDAVGGVQFTLVGAEGLTFTTLEGGDGLSSSDWIVAWNQLDGRTVRVVIISRRPSVALRGTATVLVAQVHGNGNGVVGVQEAVVCDNLGRALGVREGSVEWRSEADPRVRFAGNYPNPFNPSTVISYWLTSPGSVRLSVYDMIGREVEVLVDGWQEAGAHSVVWNVGGRRVATGVYMAKVTTDGHSAVHRMTVVQ